MVGAEWGCVGVEGNGKGGSLSLQPSQDSRGAVQQPLPAKQQAAAAKPVDQTPFNQPPCTHTLVLIAPSFPFLLCSAAALRGAWLFPLARASSQLSLSTRLLLPFPSLPPFSQPPFASLSSPQERNPTALTLDHVASRDARRWNACGGQHPPHTAHSRLQFRLRGRFQRRACALSMRAVSFTFRCLCAWMLTCRSCFYAAFVVCSVSCCR
jgi:hypothetical protein